MSKWSGISQSKRLKCTSTEAGMHNTLLTKIAMQQLHFILQANTVITLNNTFLKKIHKENKHLQFSYLGMRNSHFVILSAKYK